MRCGAGHTLTQIPSLEDYLPCKLYKAWIVHLALAVYYSEAGRPCRVARGIELHTVECVENFHTKLEAYLICWAEIRALEGCNVPVVDA